jgi:hypothetical protein
MTYCMLELGAVSQSRPGLMAANLTHLKLSLFFDSSVSARPTVTQLVRGQIAENGRRMPLTGFERAIAAISWHLSLLLD